MICPKLAAMVHLSICFGSPHVYSNRLIPHNPNKTSLLTLLLLPSVQPFEPKIW